MKFVALAALGATLALVGCGGSSSPQTTPNSDGAGLNASPKAPPSSAPWYSRSNSRPPNAARSPLHSGRSATSARRHRAKVESQAQLGRRRFRIIYAGTGCPGPCTPTLQRRGAHTWETIKRLTDSQGFGERVLAGGGNVYVVSFGHIAGGAPDAHARLDISHDEGATWSVRGDPCGRLHGREEDTSSAAAAGARLALLCEPRTTSKPFFVALSPDGGKTFVRSAPIPLPFATSVSVSAGGTLTVSNRHRGRAVSHDGGRTWIKANALTGPRVAPAPQARPPKAHSCSLAQATHQLRKRGLLPRSQNFERASDLICHDLTGDGSPEMAFTRESGGSAGYLGWGVFTKTSDGRWTLALFRPRPTVALKLAGDDLLVGNWRYRGGDAHCCPSGGYRIRRYSYDAPAGAFRKTGDTTKPRRVGQRPPRGFAH